MTKSHNILGGEEKAKEKTEANAKEKEKYKDDIGR
jgi:hypothetical protein